MQLEAAAHTAENFEASALHLGITGLSEQQQQIRFHCRHCTGEKVSAQSANGWESRDRNPDPYLCVMALGLPSKTTLTLLEVEFSVLLDSINFDF